MSYKTLLGVPLLHTCLYLFMFKAFLVLLSSVNRFDAINFEILVFWWQGTWHLAFSSQYTSTRTNLTGTNHDTDIIYIKNEVIGSWKEVKYILVENGQECGWELKIRFRTPHVPYTSSSPFTLLPHLLYDCPFDSR